MSCSRVGGILSRCQKWASTPAVGVCRIQMTQDRLGFSCTLLLTRQTSFFNKLRAEDIWKGIAGLSNAGRKRGRGRKGGAKRVVDLNRGQILGEGQKRMVLPGLNAKLHEGKKLIKIEPLASDPNRQTKLVEARKLGSRGFGSRGVAPLQRGWSGNRFPGTSIGPPDPVGDYTFEDFDTKVLELKLVSNMTANFGRKQRFSAFVITGNKNGLAGFALAKGSGTQIALRKAKNKAAQHLQYVEMYNNHTVFHNFYTKERQTAIMVNKQPEGYGLVCHRALKTICEVIGLKDMYAKVEGSTGNIQNLTKAFFAGLRNQETHQELADRMKLHVVEFRSEMDKVPLVVASPSDKNVTTTPVNTDTFNFDNLYFGGRVPYVRPKRPPFYEKLPFYRLKRLELYKLRNQHLCQRQRRVYNLEPSTKEFKRLHLPLKASRDV